MRYRHYIISRSGLKVHTINKQAVNLKIFQYVHGPCKLTERHILLAGWDCVKMSILKNNLQRFPGRKKFGVYRFMPIFFGLGALLEFTMIHLSINDHSFYKTYSNKQLEKEARRQIHMEKLKDLVFEEMENE